MGLTSPPLSAKLPETSPLARELATTYGCFAMNYELFSYCFTCVMHP